jgi:type I restriction enzyme S subunit
MSDYCDSGIESIAKVPCRWQRSSIRAITRLRNERGRPDLPLLSVYREFGVILKNSRDDNRNPEGQDLNSYKVVKEGDLVLNKMKTWQGSLGVSKYHGIVSPAYIVCELRSDVVPRFIHYLLRSDPYVFEYNRISYGVRIGQWDMRYDEFKRIPVFLPSIEEQHLIAEFLDTRLRELDKLIDNYRHLVGVVAKSLAEKRMSLLHEYRQSLVAEVVTGKLDIRRLASSQSTIANKPDIRESASGFDTEMIDSDEHALDMELTNADD